MLKWGPIASVKGKLKKKIIIPGRRKECSKSKAQKLALSFKMGSCTCDGVAVGVTVGSGCWGKRIGSFRTWYL